MSHHRHTLSTPQKQHQNKSVLSLIYNVPSVSMQGHLNNRCASFITFTGSSFTHEKEIVRHYITARNVLLGLSVSISDYLCCQPTCGICPLVW